jgi:hypothetical protein
MLISYITMSRLSSVSEVNNCAVGLVLFCFLSAPNKLKVHKPRGKRNCLLYYMKGRRKAKQSAGDDKFLFLGVGGLVRDRLELRLLAPVWMQGRRKRNERPFLQSQARLMQLFLSMMMYFMDN